ncbi:MAG TPA: hypothetical protein VK508_21875 [Cyclobacteriaceae bacterium]|nr:hypothetical protein [Cyclobacteriaceae bacterium]
MKRRAFIKTGIALTGAAVAVYIFPAFKSTVRRILTKDTEGLRVNLSSINQFIDDAQREQFLNTFSRVKRILITIHTYAGPFRGILPYANKCVQYRGQITGHFLLSTDLFRNKMDTSKPVEYTGFYNPYTQPCSNPFSSIYYPETA